MTEAITITPAKSVALDLALMASNAQVGHRKRLTSQEIFEPDAEPGKEWLRPEAGFITAGPEGAFLVMVAPIENYLTPEVRRDCESEARIIAQDVAQLRTNELKRQRRHRKVLNLAGELRGVVHTFWLYMRRVKDADPITRAMAFAMICQIVERDVEQSKRFVKQLVK